MTTTIFPPAGVVRSMQWGTTNGNVTVAPVNMSKSILITTGVASSTNNPENASLVKSTSTLLTYSKGAIGGSPNVAWQLIEYY